MPYIVVNPDNRIDIGDMSRYNFKYTYPKDSDGKEMDLRPTSPLHMDLVSKILRYGLESNTIRSSRHHVWHDMDDKLTAFIPPDAKEKLVKANDRRKPISIVFPYSYAILETLVSYLVAAFAEPLFRYEGVGPEDVAGSTLLEKVINLHCIRQKVALNLHTMFRDSAAYGFSAVSPQWVMEYGKKIVKQPNVSYGRDGTPNTAGTVRQVVDALLFEGNALTNIDPYCYLPDPNAPIHSPQEGQYVGWVDQTNIMDLLSLESQNDSGYFNVRYLQMHSNKTNSIFGLSKLNRTRQHGVQHYPRNSRLVADPVDLFHIYVKLIPHQWKLGKSRIPEKWLFTLGADCVIIQAHKSELIHNKFPIAVSAPDFDGYSPVAYSRLEILSGMQTTIDWLFNSHIANVRKAINDVLIVDPYMININDLKDPGPGGLVRLRRPAWGKGVKDAVMQLNVQDITRQNIQEVSAIIQYMQTIGGTDNTVMGSLRSGGPDRLSSAEFKGTAQGAVSRLERVAKIIGLQAMQDIGYFFAYHTQQFMQEDVWIKTVGSWPEKVLSEFNVQEGRVQVKPEDILVDYDLLVRDGSVPGGNYSEAWTQLFQIIGNSPELQQRIDIFRVFKYIATNLGAKNIDDFEVQQQPQPQAQAQVAPQVQPDEAVQQQVQRGNLIPLGA